MRTHSAFACCGRTIGPLGTTSSADGLSKGWRTARRGPRHTHLENIMSHAHAHALAPAPAISLGLSPREHALLAHASPRLRQSIARVLAKLGTTAADAAHTASPSRRTSATIAAAAAALAARKNAPRTARLSLSVPPTANASRPLAWPGKKALLACVPKAATQVRFRRRETAVGRVGGKRGGSVPASASRDELRSFGVEI